MFADLHVLFYFMYIVECLLIFMSFLLLAYCFVAVKVINHNVVIVRKRYRPSLCKLHNCVNSVYQTLKRTILGETTQ